MFFDTKRSILAESYQLQTCVYDFLTGLVETMNKLIQDTITMKLLSQSKFLEKSKNRDSPRN